MICRILFLSFLALFGMAKTAMAGSCPRVSGGGGSCSANYQLDAAAHDCVEGLDNAILSNRAALSVYMAATDKATANAQNLQVKNTVNDLDTTTRALDGLINMGNQAIQNVQGYTKALGLPLGMSPGLAAGLGLKDFFESFPCYRFPKAGLGAAKDGLEKRVSDLNNTRNEVQGLNLRTKNALKSIGEGNDSPGLVLKSGPTGTERYPTSVPKGRDRPVTSDVTGVQEAMQREQEMQKAQEMDLQEMFGKPR